MNVVRHKLASAAASVAVAATAVAIGAAVFAASTAYGGFLLAPGLRSGVMSFDDKDSEPTPNYYGFGGALSVGYSAGQKFDMALFGQYSPGKQKRPVANAEDASLFAYGGEIAARINDRVYFGVRGGTATYNLLAPPQENEINGKWTGPAFGFSIGAFASQDRDGMHAWQVTLDALHAIVSPVDEVAKFYEDDKRRITCFSLSLTFVFNRRADNVIENRLFKSFLESSFFKW